MGEIGIPRREFLHELQFWEINAIIRGYRKRNRLIHQLLAEEIYATIHANPYRKPINKPVDAMFPQIFDNDDEEEEEPPMTDEEYKELQDELAYFNSLSPEELWGKKAED